MFTDVEVNTTLVQEGEGGGGLYGDGRNEVQTSREKERFQKDLVQI